MKKLNDYTIVEQAAVIMTATEGSWLFNATYPSNQSDAWCKNFVDEFLRDHSADDQRILDEIQEREEHRA